MQSLLASTSAHITDRLACPCFQNTRLACPCAEASCSSTVRAARRVIADIGERAAASSGGLLELSKCREHDAENDTHRLFVERLHLSLEKWVPLSSLKHNGQRLTVLRLRDWLQFLVDKSCWHILTGLVRRDPGRERAILKTFWEKYRCTHEDHPIFSMAREGLVSLERTAPLLYHGDEGRGRRRTPFLVSSWSSFLGRGSAPADKYRKEHGVRNEYIKHRTNFRGHSFTNRFFQATEQQ